MSWTKKQFISQAFESIGLASYQYDMQPEQFQSAGVTLDMMMASWGGKGIRIGYPIATNPEDIDVDMQTNVPDSANQAIVNNLALLLGPSYGKVVSPETKRAAKSGYDVLAARGQAPGPKQMPKGYPRGAGRKTWRNNDRPFTRGPDDEIELGSDAKLDFD